MSEPPSFLPPDAAHIARLGAYELLGVLGRGSSAVVYRGRHVDGGAAVAVKQVFLSDPAGLEGLRREIAILGRLRHPGVARILERGVHEGSPWYAMELVEGRSLEAIWAEARDTRDAAASLRVLQRLCLTLGFVHGEGLVHRDVKPGNVIVRSDGSPVLVDFGFAAGFAGPTGREVLERGGELLGSFTYMAPEQLRGEFVDARADLYALGCMLYEAIVGAPPFVGAAWRVAQAHLEAPPSPPSSRGKAIDADLEAMILALLAKVPRERPGYASDVARRIGAVLGDPPDTASVPAPVTYLYRASFVGRGAALARLDSCLADAAGGRTVCALVAGESGVGKTRLAMEVTRAAVDHRFAVVTGECLPSDAGGGPLHPLQPALQRLADVCRQGGPDLARRILSGRAGVLAAVEPTLASVPGLEHEPAPAPLPAAAARERLVRILVDALNAWAREEPVAVVLDDLQWADELTLAGLETLVATVPASPLLVLGLLRSEEESPRLRALAAGGAVRIPLDRLDRGAIDAIVSDMLAMPRAPRALVDFLATQSEGNPFFVSEYLRTAVGAGLLVRGAAGQWRVEAGGGAYAALGLPHTLRELVERRLNDLGGAARMLVTAAAVLGRDFDPELAADLLSLDGPAQVEALAELRARQVAEVGPGGLWRFAHDKLREVAYEVTAPERRQRLHGAAATAIEARMANDPRAPEHFAGLAHHFSAAGDTRRAGEYFGRAGEHALAGGALDAARTQLAMALAHVPAAGPIDPRRAHWLRLLAETNAGTDLAAAITQTGEALRLLGQRVPRSAAGWIALTVGELARRLTARPSAAPEVAIEAAQVASRAANSFYFQFDILPGMASSLRCVNLAEAAGEPGRAALPYAQLGYVAGGARLHRLAARCFARAHALRDAKATDPSDFAAGLYFHAMYEMGFARWQRSEELANVAVARLQTLGNYQEAEVAGTVLANTLHYAGRFAAAEVRCAEVEASAERRGHVQHYAWGLFLRGRERLAVGDVSGARELIERGYARLVSTSDFVSLVMCEGLLARARWCSGDADGAARAADAFATRLGERRLVPLAQCLDGYWAYADVRLRLWAVAPSGAAATAAAQACAVLRRFARLFPMARPAAIRAHARRQWLLGHRTRARRSWLRSLQAAHDLSMPYDEAGAQLDLVGAEGDDGGAAVAAARLDGLGCGPATARLEGFGG